ncbi:MAG: hypothetical protein WBA76_11060 [Phormidesmis sp.]
MSLFILNFKKLGYKKWSPWIGVTLLLALPLLLLELWTNHSLFDYVSYTNSRNMDPQIKYFEARHDWEYVAIGSSETKWGIAPAQIEAAFAENGIQTHGFNLGFDGFSENYYKIVLPRLSLPARLPQMKIVLIGINLIEELKPLADSFDQGFSCDGLLQRTVLTSAFAKDYGLYYLCNTQKWPAPLVEAFENISGIVRYRQALRTLMLGQNSDDFVGIASNGLTQYPDGFYAHKPIRDNQKESDIDHQNFLNKSKESPEMFLPMPAIFWPKLLAPQGFFDQWTGYFKEYDILPIFFALPTNPVMIDAQNRRADYLRNSQLMKDWAAKRSSVLFVDLGIRDSYDPTGDFADYRHLSEAGARKFSHELGMALAQKSEVVRTMSER